MTAMETSTTRFDIEPYTVNRGNFLPGDPHIRIAVSIYGVVAGSRAASWNDIGAAGMALWDGAACGPLWMPVPRSEQLPMYGTSGAVVDVLPEVPGDSTCPRTFRAARTRSGASFSGGSGMQGVGSWVILASKPVSGGNGRILSLGLYTQSIGIAYEAGSLVFTLTSADGIPIAIGNHPVDATNRYVPVVAISTDPGVLRIIVRDSGVPTTYTWLTGGQVVADQFTIGGPDSPESILYAAAAGGGGGIECERYLRLFSGLLS